MISIQTILKRVREPRIKISYLVDTNGAQKAVELPFVVGVIADVFGSIELQNYLPYRQRDFLYIDRDSFSTIMKTIGPKLLLNIKDYTHGSSESSTSKVSVTLSFDKMDDFHPDSILQQVDFLKKLYSDRLSFIDLATKIDTNEHWSDMVGKLLEDSNLLMSLIDLQTAPQGLLDLAAKYKISVDNNLFVTLKNMATVLHNNNINQESYHNNPYSILMVCVKNIDLIMSNFLCDILHHPLFQKLEATWRGIQYLVNQTETGASIKIRLFPCTFGEMYDDLTKASEFDQSTLFKKIYEEEYGVYGGNPYSNILLDWGATNSSQDINFMRALIKVCAAAHVPCFAAAKAELFGLTSYQNLPQVRDVAKLFESSTSVEWNALREEEDSRYLGLLLPSVLMRNIYSTLNNPIQSFAFNEVYDGNGFDDFCWGNPVYFMGTRVTAAFANYGWVTAIRGVAGGGLVENLPTFNFATVRGDIILKSPVEISLTDRREKELSDLGFIGLCPKKQSNQAVFLGSQSIQKPIVYLDSHANENAVLSTRISYLLNASRFAHYIKIMMRERIGSFESVTGIENFLRNWISQYVLLNDDPSQELASQYPLRAYSLSVLSIEGKPGEFDVMLRVQPHLQLEGLNVDISLVARIGDGSHV